MFTFNTTWSLSQRWPSCSYLHSSISDFLSSSLPLLSLFDQGRFVSFLFLVSVNLRGTIFTVGDRYQDYFLGVAFGWLIVNALRLPINDLSCEWP